MALIGVAVALLYHKNIKQNLGYWLKFVSVGAALPTLLLLATVLIKEDNLILLSSVRVYVTIIGVGGILFAITSLFD